MNAALRDIVSLFPPSAPLKLVSSVFLHFLFADGLVLRGATPLVRLAYGETSAVLQIYVNNEFERASRNELIRSNRALRATMYRSARVRRMYHSVLIIMTLARAVSALVCLLQVHPILIGLLGMFYSV